MLKSYQGENLYPTSVSPEELEKYIGYLRTLSLNKNFAIPTTEKSKKHLDTSDQSIIKFDYRYRLLDSVTLSYKKDSCPVCKRAVVMGVGEDDSSVNRLWFWIEGNNGISCWDNLKDVQIEIAAAFLPAELKQFLSQAVDPVKKFNKAEGDEDILSDEELLALCKMDSIKSFRSLSSVQSLDILTGEYLTIKTHATDIYLCQLRKKLAKQFLDGSETEMVESLQAIREKTESIKVDLEEANVANLHYAEALFFYKPEFSSEAIKIYELLLKQNDALLRAIAKLRLLQINERIQAKKANYTLFIAEAKEEVILIITAAITCDRQSLILFLALLVQAQDRSVLIKHLKNSYKEVVCLIESRETSNKALEQSSPEIRFVHNIMFVFAPDKLSKELSDKMPDASSFDVAWAKYKKVTDDFSKKSSELNSEQYKKALAGFLQTTYKKALVEFLQTPYTFANPVSIAKIAYLDEQLDNKDEAFCKQQSPRFS